MARAMTIATSIMIAAGLGACSDSNQDERILISGLPNPAAVYCEEQGGTYDLATGRCTLPDDSVVDAWDFYREAHQARQVGLPNPAAVFCNEHGSYNLETGECTLEDGSVVDAWQYFRDKHSG